MKTYVVTTKNATFTLTDTIDPNIQLLNDEHFVNAKVYKQPLTVGKQVRLLFTNNEQNNRNCVANGILETNDVVLNITEVEVHGD